MKTGLNSERHVLDNRDEVQWEKEPANAATHHVSINIGEGRAVSPSHIAEGPRVNKAHARGAVLAHLRCSRRKRLCSRRSKSSRCFGSPTNSSGYCFKNSSDDGRRSLSRARPSRTCDVGSGEGHTQSSRPSARGWPRRAPFCFFLPR